MRSEEPKSKKEQVIWGSKIARYLAYCVNGGLLPQFNIKTMVQLMDCD